MIFTNIHMFAATTTKLLKEKLPRVPQMVVEAGLYHDIGDLVASAELPRRLAVVDDKHTSYALGDSVFKALRGQDGVKHITLEGTPAADGVTVEQIRRQSVSCDALVAVGSGTIGDLCKYAAHLDGKPYVVFPTAASMNGYLSANASITVNGYKKTVPAQMPLAVFCDVAVIAAAPARLNKSGLGDSLARPTAQADWLLSHLLLGTAYDAAPFALLAGVEDELFDRARGVALADRETLALLMKVMLLSGLGMTMAKGSYPASQGEHMVAHAYGMLRSIKSGGLPTLHGEEIGVTTLVMARLQEKMLRSNPRFLPGDFDEGKIAGLFGGHVAGEAKKAFAVKRALQEKKEISGWESIAAQVEKVTIPAARLQAILEAAEAPVTPEKLGWDAAQLALAAENARYLRERFTFLDLATG